MAHFKPLTINEIKDIIKSELIGNPDELVFGLNRIDNASDGELTFFNDKKFIKSLINTKSSCVIVPKDLDLTPYPKRNYLLADNPHFALYLLLKHIENNQKIAKSGIHSTAIVGENTEIAKSAFIGPNVVVGDDCKVGNNTKIEANCVVANNCVIGDDSILYPNVTLYTDTIIGNNTILHSGAVIGSDGFGFLDEKDGSYTKIPQLGNVVLGNNVEIGANTCVDRSLIGTTIISDGVKLDNLIQIGHNVEIGENTASASQTGVAGSTRIGKNCRIGGQVGFAGHIDIADEVIIFAQSGVAQSIEKKGIYMGSPTRDRMKYFKIDRSLDSLPEIVYDFERKKKELQKNQ